jgi:hypothetical protein
MSGKAKLIYNSHKFVRNRNWHKIRVVVSFELIMSNGARTSDKTVEVDISDMWLAKHGLQLATSLPLSVFQEVLTIASRKLRSDSFFQNIPRIDIQHDDNVDSATLNPMSEVMIETHQLTEG